MAASSELADFLDRAGNVFSLAGQLGRAFHEEHKRNRSGFVGADNWAQHATVFEQLYQGLVELREPIQRPPAGFAPVAVRLKRAGQIVNNIRKARKKGEGDTFLSYLDLFTELYTVAKAGRDAIDAITETAQSDDQLALVEEVGEDSQEKRSITMSDQIPAMPADLQVVKGLLKLAIRERDAILSALKADKRSPGLQSSIADFSAGRVQDFAAGETSRLLNEPRPRSGYGGFQTAYQQANADVIDTGLGAHFLPKLESVYKTHIALLEEAQEAFEQSSIQLTSLETHCRAVSDLIDVVRLYTPEVPEVNVAMQQLPNTVTPLSETGVKKPNESVGHSPDFRSLRWFDETFSFTANQAMVIKVLYENYLTRTPDVGDETLLQAVDPAAPPARLSTLFRGNSAWGTIIVHGGSKGSHRLTAPTDKKRSAHETHHVARV